MNYEALIVSVVVVVGIYSLTRWFMLDVKCKCGHELRDHYGIVLPMGVGRRRSEANNESSRLGAWARIDV